MVTEHEAQAAIYERLAVAASMALKDLLENRHLYQKSSVEKPIDVAANTLDGRTFTNFLKWVNEAAGDPRFSLYGGIDYVNSRPAVHLRIGNIKTYCRTCRAREAHALLHSSELHDEVRSDQSGLNTRYVHDAKSFLYFLAFACQNCATTAVGFLVHARGYTFTLEGRSPFEHVIVPKFIPKAEEALFREMLLAKQTGRVLGAIFFLRCFIEQAARRLSGADASLRGADLFDAYSATLPADRRGILPSLGKRYEELSAAIHGANADEILLETSIAEVIKHFDMRRLFELPDQPSPLG